MIADSRLFFAESSLGSWFDVGCGAVEAIMDTTESVLRLPEMAAMLEIHLARRNDPDLDRLTKPIYKRFDRHVRLWLRLVRRSAGILKPSCGVPKVLSV